MPTRVHGRYIEMWKRSVYLSLNNNGVGIMKNSIDIKQSDFLDLKIGGEYILEILHSNVE